jgi:two-component system cell cycle response regulator DivK
VVFRSVLIIDNDEPSVKLARTVLEAEGWRIMHASRGEHASAVLKSVRPSLIVTALSVPVHAAFELVRELRTQARNIPIIAVTALNGPETELAALRAGCSGYIRKPIDISTFSAQLSAYLGNQP